MMVIHKERILLLLLIFLGLGFYLIGIIKAQGCRLIPREVLFGAVNKKIQPRISPNGQFLAYLSPVNTVMNIWVRSIDKNDDRQITHDTNRGIQGYWWSYDNEHLFYKQDTAGNENWRLYGVSVKDGSVKEYTPFDTIQVNLVEYSKEFPRRMLLGINKRDPKLHDVYELDIQTGDLKLIAENTGKVVSWVATHNLEVLGKVESSPQGGYILFVRTTMNDPWRELAVWKPSEAMPGEMYFSKDLNSLYVIDTRDNNTSRFVKIDIKTGAITPLFSDPHYDLGGDILIDQESLEPVALSYMADRKKWIFFDKETEKTFSLIRDIDHGDIAVLGRSLDNNSWIVGFVKDNGPISFWLYDRVNNKPTFLFDHQPIYKKYKLASMEPIEFKARDGLTVHGYLTMPCGDKKTGLPLVLVVHGGPWLRDSWGFDAESQWLANRGYAVLHVNFRGSIGYGKSFLYAGAKQWGRAMQDDLTDAVHWAVDKGIADPKRVAIYGGSYGGYAALAGATFTPDLYACAIDVVGVSNLFTFFESIPPYWELFLATLKNRIGDPETEKEFLTSISPLFHVDAIKIPILIAQGANDPRVKQAESEQIVEAMKKKGIEYEYLLFPDEGHGFVKPENRLKFYKTAEKFLAKYLGGCYEP
jgi:dipeptidyl aminopeptidase/acylaminoacyl peptidase